MSGIKHLLPPFNIETGKEKVQSAEKGWNKKNTEKECKAYTIDNE